MPSCNSGFRFCSLGHRNKLKLTAEFNGAFSGHNSVRNVITQELEGLAMELSKSKAALWFRHIGFTVEEIEESDTPRADLKLNDGEQTYVVEVKEKVDTGAHSTTQTVDIPNDSVTFRVTKRGRLNRLDAILRNADKQIESTPRENESIGLVWMQFDGDTAAEYGTRLPYSFYGIADLVPRGHGGCSLNCLYFDYSTAFEVPNVCGVLICENDSLQLAINQFAQNSNYLRSSKLAKRLGASIYDPLELTKQQNVLLLDSLDSPIPRKKENEGRLLNAVLERTGKEYSRANLSRYSLE